MSSASARTLQIAWREYQRKLEEEERQRWVLVPAYYAYRKRDIDYRPAYCYASDQLRDFSATSHWLRSGAQQLHLLIFPLEDE